MSYPTLYSFFGSTPNDDFIEDLELLKQLEEKETLAIIEHIIAWNLSDEGLNSNWEQWLEKIPEDKQAYHDAAIRFFNRIFSEFLAENITEDEIREDFKQLGLNEQYIDHFISNLKSGDKDRFKKLALAQYRPYENTPVLLDWRIDERHYRDGTKQRVAVIEFNYSIQGETEVVQFDMNEKGMTQLMRMFEKIKQELVKE